MDINTNERSLITYNDPTDYYLHDYLVNDSLDKTGFFSIKNTVGIQLCEGFNKWAQAGLTAFMTYEYRHFSLPDSVPGSTLETRKKYKENVVRIGAQIARTQGRTLHYDVTGETVILGEDLGEFSIDGKADLNFRLLKDTVTLSSKAYVKNTNPIFYYRHYHSQHLWWDNDNLSKIFRTRIEGDFNIRRTRTRLRVAVENIKNFTYVANVSESYTTDNNTILFKNNLAIRQESENIQLLTAILKQDFKMGILHLDTEIAYQKSSNKTVLPVPEFTLYGNLYLQFKLAKVLNMQLGADVSYFTKYIAPEYSPALGQYNIQNPEYQVEVGNYPFVNVYINAHLKRTRFFVMMYHVNQGTGNSNYFSTPHYPVNPRTFKLSISWNVFD